MQLRKLIEMKIKDTAERITVEAYLRQLEELNRQNEKLRAENRQIEEQITSTNAEIAALQNLLWLVNLIRTKNKEMSGRKLYEADIRLLEGLTQLNQKLTAEYNSQMASMSL